MKAIAEMKLDTEQKMKLKQLYKADSEWNLNSWLDRSLGQSVWTKFSGRGFKSHSGPLSIATWKSLSVLNTMSIIPSATLMWLPQANFS